MLFIDVKYVGLLSGRLERFKRKSDNTYNCRCPICGDSQSNKAKTRGYIYEKKGNMMYYCHNCGASMSLGSFIKTIDPNLFKEYTQEQFIEKYGSTGKLTTPKPDITKIAIPHFIKFSPLKKLKKISQLDHMHPAKRYVDKRKIPSRLQYKLFYAPKFKQWVNTFVPGKFADEAVDEPRLIIPFLDQQGNFFGLQGRAFGPNNVRYITIIVDDTKPKIFGLDTVDTSKTIYVTEGPIDSMFLDNAIAMAGADLDTSWLVNKDRLVMVYDNEPRNKDIVKRIQNAVDKGFKVCIWPHDLPHKDVNDMVMDGMSSTEIKTMIDTHTYHDLSAQLALTNWKKI